MVATPLETCSDRECFSVFQPLLDEKPSAKQMLLEVGLNECQKRCDGDPTADNLNDLESLQAEYDSHFEYITQGSRVNWYEQGEKSNKYFLKLENNRKKKSCITKIYVDENNYISEPNKILTEIQNFCSKL